MPRTKGSKNRPKINTTNDYASQIAEKKEASGMIVGKHPKPLTTITY